MTKRISKQDIYVYFSNIAASVLAVMGAFGFAMNFIEEKYEKFKKNRVVKRSLESLENNRRQLAEKNFISLKDDFQPIKTSNLTDYIFDLEEFAIPADNFGKIISNNYHTRRNSMVFVKV
jgi:hypothetical protein